MKMFCKRLFSGGKCNYIDENGELQRNPDRDELNTMLRDIGHDVFDPQIDLVSHGRPYNYATDGPAEQKAREGADILLYEVDDATFAGVSMLEVQKDVARGKRVILWLSSPPNEKGKPVFRPQGLKLDSISDKATLAHVKQMLKQADSMRANLLDFTSGANNLCVVQDETTQGVIKALKQFSVRF